MLQLHLTERTLRDLIEIEKYSIREFGKKVANRYLSKFETAFNLIKENRELLKSDPDFHEWLKFYRVEKHMLICDDTGSGIIFVLTVLHATMDIPTRLIELEPTLQAETEILHQQLRQKK